MMMMMMMMMTLHCPQRYTVHMKQWLFGYVYNSHVVTPSITNRPRTKLFIKRQGRQ